MPPKKPAPKPILLDENQELVAQFRKGYARVLASAGAGKTGTFVERYVRLINEGVNPESILSLSFTAVAAKNLRDRVEARVGKLSGKRTSGATTFHGLALAFCTQEAHEFEFKLAEFPLCPEPVANKLAGDAGRRYEVDYRSLRPFISLQKRHRISPAAAIRTSETSGKDVKLALAYKDYQKRMRETETLDFDSLMFEMVELLEKKPDVRKRWQYSYIMCDEAQDCCTLDFQLLKLLSGEYKSLMCCGDPAQSIFGFRGSDASLLLNMHETFPDTEKFYLGRNYRSTPELVSFLKTICPCEELAGYLTTSNPSGPEKEVVGFKNPLEEANWVVEKIKEGL